MTTDEQAPVLPDEGCWCPTHGYAEGCPVHERIIVRRDRPVPAPEETVETTVERTVDIFARCPDGSLHFWSMFNDEGESQCLTCRATRRRAPALEPAGEAEERCYVCGPAPSSGTPGLTEAQRELRTQILEAMGTDSIYYVNPVPYLARYEAVIAAEVRAPLEARIAELESMLRQMWSAGEVDGRNALIARAEDAERKLLTLIDKYPWLATELTPPASTAAEEPTDA